MTTRVVRKTLSSIKRDVAAPAIERSQRRIQAPKREVLTNAVVLASVYPELDSKLASEISSLEILDPRHELYITLLQEIVASFLNDAVLTRQLLTEELELEDLYSRLPSLRQLELIHFKSTEEEFRAVTGAIMRTPCKVCKGTEFYFDAERQTSSADEAPRQQIFCVNCKPRYN